MVVIRLEGSKKVKKPFHSIKVTIEVILYCIEYLYFNIHMNCLIRLDFKQKIYILVNVNFWIKILPFVTFYDLLWHSMTLEVIHNKIKKLSLYNVIIHTNFHPNRFINECAKNKKLKSRKYFVICKRTYVLNKIYNIF